MLSLDATVVVLVTGDPGSGKSTLAAALAASAPELRHISNDILRRELMLLPEDPRNTPLIYAEMAGRACAALAMDRIPLLDATFYQRRYREIVIDRLRNNVAHWIILSMNTPSTVCRRRVEERKAGRRTLFRGIDSMLAFDRVVARTEAIDCEEFPTRATLLAVQSTSWPPVIQGKCDHLPKVLRNALAKICSGDKP